MKRKTWRDKLTKSELTHIKASMNGRVTLERIRENVLFQRGQEFPCWDCIEIGRKLGIN